MLNYYWNRDLILRTEKPIHEYQRFFKGRAGIRGTVRYYYLYLLNSEKAKSLLLYPDLKEVKVFNIYKYYYHESMAEEDLKAAVLLKEGYVRKMKGRDARVGHNWEACVEWFIDRFTRGAEFQTQEHRDRDMDPRRITLHLIKNVGDRRRGAEVDRVWMRCQL